MHNGAMVALLLSLLGVLRSAFRTRADLALESLAVRQQLANLRRTSGRPRLRQSDRAFWLVLSRLWSRWADVLVVVKPDTVVRWHRAGFRLFWRWKSRSRGPVEGSVSPEVRQLIRHLAKANPSAEHGQNCGAARSRRPAPPLRTPRGLTGASLCPADADMDGQPLPTRRGSPRSDADRVPDVGALAREHDFALTFYPESATRRSRMTSWRRTGLDMSWERNLHTWIRGWASDRSGRAWASRFRDRGYLLFAFCNHLAGQDLQTFDVGSASPCPASRGSGR
jgi:hypothetical protein